MKPGHYSRRRLQITWDVVHQLQLIGDTDFVTRIVPVADAVCSAKKQQVSHPVVDGGDSKWIGKVERRVEIDLYQRYCQLNGRLWCDSAADCGLCPSSIAEVAPMRAPLW